jgi:hypothetical protein
MGMLDRWSTRHRAPPQSAEAPLSSTTRRMAGS